MELEDRIYRRSASGDDALASVDVAVPTEYRRILALIEGDTHSFAADLYAPCTV